MISYLTIHGLVRITTNYLCQIFGFALCFINSLWWLPTQRRKEIKAKCIQTSDFKSMNLENLGEFK